MLPPVFQTLKASADVKNIVGTNPPRIFRHGAAPQDVTRPYITWFAITAIPHNNLSDLPPGDRIAVQVDCWHPSDAGVEMLAKAARDVVEPYAHMTAMPIDGKDQETNLYRISLQFDWFVDR